MLSQLHVLAAMFDAIALELMMFDAIALELMILIVSDLYLLHMTLPVWWS